VTDFANYANWVSDLKRVDVLERDADGRALEVEYRARRSVDRRLRVALRLQSRTRIDQLASDRGDLTETMQGQYDSTSRRRDAGHLRLEVELLSHTHFISHVRQRIQTSARRVEARAESLR